MRTIGVVTVARSDFGHYRPILRRIQNDSGLRGALYVSGMHLSPTFGNTIKEVEASGFPIAARIHMSIAGDTPEAVAKSIGLGTIGFGQAFTQRAPDLLLVLGDRFEMFAAALAALPFRIPVAHVHGGELTEGAMDDSLRHGMTKLSHLHFVATAEYARRVMQMGEEPWRVIVAGSPSLDNLHETPKLSRPDLEALIGLSLTTRPLLVTFHPVTLELDQLPAQANELFAALNQVDLPIVFTAPNADMAGHCLLEMIQSFVAKRKETSLVLNLGTAGYFSLMSFAAAMVGNSSSGLIEAVSFRLPVVNIGNRQRGRVRAPNVIDVPCERGAIIAGINRALHPEFRLQMAEVENPYGDGSAAKRIVDRLRDVPLQTLVIKRFYDLPVGVAP